MQTPHRHQEGAPEEPADALHAPGVAAPAHYGDRPRHVPVTGEARAIARATLAVLGIVVGSYLLWYVRRVLFLLFLAVLLATAIEPLVNRLRHGPFSRGSGVLIVYTGIVLAVAIPTVVIVPSVAAQASVFTESLPDNLATLRAYGDQLAPRPLRPVVDDLFGQLSSAVQQQGAPRGDQLVAAGTTAVGGLIDFVTVFVLAFYWIVERASIKRHVLRLVSPARARDVNVLWMAMEEKLGAWVRGQLLCMLAVGAIAGVGFVLIGLPVPALLALVAGLCEAIPLVGPLLAFAPAVMVALTVGPATAVVVVAFAIVVQQVESNILVPRVLSQTLGISPLVVILGILCGATLSGVWGALVAVPIAAALQVLLTHLLGSDDAMTQKTAIVTTCPAAPSRPRVS